MGIAASPGGGACSNPAKMEMVGTGGFEPPTPASRRRCSTRLSYVPSQSGRLYLSDPDLTSGGRQTCADAAAAEFGADGELQPSIGLSMSRPSSQLGCRQVVRHRFLVPTFPGSNPGTPATFLFQFILGHSPRGLFRSLRLQTDRILVALRLDRTVRAANCDASLCLHIKTVSFLNCYRSTIDQRGCYC